MIQFLTRACIRDKHGFSTVFPDLDHKRPDFQVHKRRHAMKQPPYVDDDFPANVMRDDCTLLSDPTLRALVADLGLLLEKTEEHLTLEIAPLREKLHPLSSQARLSGKTGKHVFLRNILRICAEGAFVGATHLVMTPVFSERRTDA